MVGLSVRNLDNLIRQRVRPQLVTVARLLAVVRGESRAPIVLGGSAVSIAGAATLRRLDADYAIVGEGERSFVLLLAALSGGRPLETVPGLLRRAGGDVLATPPERDARFGRSGLERWVDWRDYERLGSTWPIQAKRGCPLPCNYCLYGAIEGARHRLRAPADVVDEMAAVQAAARPRAFEFVDSTFNVPTDHALAVCDEIARRDLRTALTAQGVNPLGASPTLMAAMRRAGFNSFMVSAESASDRMLSRLGKGYTSAHVHRTRDATRDSGMVSLWFFMLGGPGETEATVEETVSFAERQLDWKGCLAIFFTGIRVLPGTEIEQIAKAEGQIAAGRRPRGASLLPVPRARRAPRAAADPPGRGPAAQPRPRRGGGRDRPAPDERGPAPPRRPASVLALPAARAPILPAAPAPPPARRFRGGLAPASRPAPER